MISASSLRGSARAASLLAVMLFALMAHTCGPLSLAHSHAAASTVTHQHASDDAAAMHGSCCEAMLLSAPARSPDATDLAGALLAYAVAADTAAPLLEVVAAAPSLMSRLRPPLFLLHATLRI